MLGLFAYDRETVLSTGDREPAVAVKIPAGFEEHPRRSMVTDAWRPLYSRNASGIVQIGLWLRGVHCNSRGFVHGGVIATLADNAMGLSLFESLRVEGDDTRRDGDALPRAPLTISLAIDYVATAKTSQWLQINPRIVKVGRSMGFVDALIMADDAVVARANASFRIEGSG
jgi:acyl-coenzyme A thioesterase PaaI-like protein